MIRVKVSVHHPNWPFTKQTPGKADHIWKDKYQFFINQDIDECDVWMVMNDLKVRNSTTYSESCLCPPENIFYFPEEPPSIRNYTPEFIRQFPRVYSCHPNMLGIPSHGFLSWFIGKGSTLENRIDFDFLSHSEMPEKTKLISLVTSSKTMTRGHRKRIAFAQKIKEKFKDKIDIYGLETPFKCKWDTLAPYKYHIAIENSSFPNYWSEKIADAYLGLSYPIYYGCPNITEYFHKDSLDIIDIEAFSTSCRTIERIIDEDFYDKKLEFLHNMKQKVLEDYNFFALPEKLGITEALASDRSKVTIYNERHFDNYFTVAQRRMRRWWMRNF